MNNFNENVGGNPTLKIEDTIVGALHDETGLAFIVLHRASNGYFRLFEIMAETPYGEVFVIEHVSTPGVFRKGFVIRMANLARTINFTPTGIVEFNENSMVRHFAAATGLHRSLARRDGGKDVPFAEYWTCADKEKMDAFILRVGGVFSTKVKPVS